MSTKLNLTEILTPTKVDLECLPSWTSWAGELEFYSRSRLPVLILGETGVGKEAVAHWVHRHSSANDKYLAVNCAAIPASIFESELFGSERGAYTGASSRQGLIKSASGGTLFLDEVGEIKPFLQSKLLRFIDSGEVRPVGTSRVESVDVRLLSATNRDLYEATAEGLFRHDLLERLSVLVVNVPPLRERPDDILFLARHWATQWQVRLEEGALRCLVTYSWPGNIRQLRNFLLRACVQLEWRFEAPPLARLLEQERWRAAPLERYPLSGGRSAGSGREWPRKGKSGRTGGNSRASDRTLRDLEKEAVFDRLLSNGGNKKDAAKSLGISKSSLFAKLRSWRAESLPMPSLPAAPPLLQGVAGNEHGVVARSGFAPSDRH